MTKQHILTPNATNIVNKNNDSVDIKLNEHSGKFELLTNMESHVCENNSFNGTLAIGETFTGVWEDSLDYGMVIIGVAADQNSATDGLKIEWSPAGVVVEDDDVFSILANRGKVFTFTPARRYFRVRYTNNGTSSASVDLQVMLKKVYCKPSSHRIRDSIVADDDAELMKSVITGVRDDGVFGNIILDNKNRLQINSQPYTYGIAEGAVAGHTSLLKFGTRTAVSAGTPSVVWEGTSATYPYMTTAQQLKVVSSSAADTAVGTGVRTVKIIGLDTNLDEIDETITMNGTTNVTTTKSFLRIFRAYGVTCGTAYTNVGKITIYNNAGTTEQAIINIGDGQTLMTVWTVPRGKVAYLVQGTCSTDSNKGVRVSFFIRQLDGGILYPWQIKYRAFLFSGNEIFPFTIPFKILERTDLEVRVTTPGSAGTTSAGATFELWYEDV